MADLIESLVLGLYVPIILFAGVACWLLVTRLLWPAFREHRLDVEHYAIALSAAFALAAHFTENVYYGSARWLKTFDVLNSALFAVGLWKLLILASAVMATAALSRAATDGPHVARLVGIALALWALGAFGAWVLV